MRIGTWNVDYGRGRRNINRVELLVAKDADIWVLTETHADVDLSKTHKRHWTFAKSWLFAELSDDPPELSPKKFLS